MAGLFLLLGLLSVGSALRLANEQVWAEFDLERPALSGLGVAGGPNLLASAPEGDPLRLRRQGLVLERDGGESGWQDPFWIRTTASSAAGPAQAAWLDPWTLQVTGVLDDAADPLVESSWTFSLPPGARSLEVEVRARAVRPAVGVQGVRLALYLAAGRLTSLYAEAGGGVVQMLDAAGGHFAVPADKPLSRFYALGRGAGSLTVDAVEGTRRAVLRSEVQGLAGAGLELAWEGEASACEAQWVDDLYWTYVDLCNRSSVAVEEGRKWSATLRLTPGARAFPGPVSEDEDEDELALLAREAIYSSAVGSLNTLLWPGMAHPTLSHPVEDSYSGSFTFFDPDSWITVSALLYADDPALDAQARQILEASGGAMLPSGQVPHHFNCEAGGGCAPQFEALSGAVQTGPNVFWIEAALGYAQETGDSDWLRAWWPRVLRALDFLLDMRDPEVGLLFVAGPLWIDTFRREAFASDTNAFMVRLLGDVARASEAIGQGARPDLEALAAGVAAAMNERLWAGDHYVTQVDRDGAVRDFVDYDSNLLAVAFGVAEGERAEAVLRRVHSGPCGTTFPTFVSERTYTAADCYEGNTGDSAVAMGRVAWAHAHALRAAGRAEELRALVLAPLRAEFERLLFMHERYTCAGQPVHNPYFVEYPSVLAMVARECR